MSIKTWRERIARVDPDVEITPMGLKWAMQAEIDDLRAALQERDAETAMLKTVLAGVKQDEAAQRKVLEQAKLALEKNIETLVAGVTYDITKNTITAIQELK